MGFGSKSGKFSIFMLTGPGSSHLVIPQALWGSPQELMLSANWWEEK